MAAYVDTFLTTAAGCRVMMLRAASTTELASDNAGCKTRQVPAALRAKCASRAGAPKHSGWPKHRRAFTPWVD